VDSQLAGGSESLLSLISREMVHAMKVYYGRGPTETKSYLLDDLLFVVMRGGTTEAERTLLEADEQEAVRRFRQTFEEVIAPQLIGIIERLTGRRVLGLTSQVIFDPDVIFETFVFETPGGGDASARPVAGGDGSWG
jgi:uncharacterized protein YbcI